MLRLGIGEHQSSAERRRVVDDTKLGFHAERASCWLGDKLVCPTCEGGISWGWLLPFVMFRMMGVRAPDLHKTFRADVLVTTTGLVHVGWIVKEADWAFQGVPVKNSLHRTPTNYPRRLVNFCGSSCSCRGWIPGRGDRKCFGPGPGGETE